MTISFRRPLFGLALAAALILPACRGASGPATTTPAAPATSPAPAASSPVAFPDAVRLTNGKLTVEVSPAAGRIVSLVPAGGTDLLWRPSAKQVAGEQAAGQYVTWGGDKVWPAMQSLWPRMLGKIGAWPPPTVVDGQPWRIVEQSPLAITIESGINPQLNVQVRRQIELDADRPHVVITNTVTRIKPSPFPVLIWSVSQIPHPSFALLDIAEDRPDAAVKWIAMGERPDRDRTWTSVIGAAAKFQPPAGAASKVGTLGRWVAAVYPRHILIHQIAFDPRGSYPDASSAQVFTDPNFTEIETLSPQVHIQPGESLTNTVHWFVLDRPEGDDQAILNAIGGVRP